jgi:hypothetical protein
MGNKKSLFSSEKRPCKDFSSKSNTSGIYPISLYVSSLKTLPGKGLWSPHICMHGYPIDASLAENIKHLCRAGSIIPYFNDSIPRRCSIFFQALRKSLSSIL